MDSPSDSNLQLSEEEVEQLYVESKLLIEDIDPEWGIQSQEQIQKKMQAFRKKGDSAIKIECKSTLCRLEVPHEDGQAAEQFNKNIQRLLACEGQYEGINQLANNLLVSFLIQTKD